ncbi:hypothetical protein MNBD_PLANCTO02-1690 [hydrothermal vent metagenome]|uniref:Uncharacterized protein n=1 Tax=hydrothermal vent metagenome TaxID=652676 RepID=A0A3B1E206_9ZZZZ
MKERLYHRNDKKQGKFVEIAILTTNTKITLTCYDTI